MTNGIGRRSRNAARAGRWSGWVSGLSVAGGGTYGSWMLLLPVGRGIDYALDLPANEAAQWPYRFPQFLSWAADTAGDIAHYGLPVAGTAASILLAARFAPRARRAVREWYMRTF